MDMTPQTWPEWYDGRHINEVLFCQQFLDKHPMKCVRGRLFTVDGLIEDEGQIGNLILEEISGVLTANLSKTVTNLLASIKLQAYSPPLPIETDRIHVANGTYFMDGSFTPNKSYCNNRLTVSYNPDAPTPKRWLQFLSELLQQEDIPTLQEFLGYCLLPTTKGQKMLMLIGKGGEGKSRIGLVMRSLLGDSMNTTSIQKVESNRFSRADLENKLLMVDDDMDMSALPKTNYIKSIVTSECKMDMERKGVQSYQSQLYVRFLCFGNGALTALHDKSDGFFRRQIVLTTKDRPTVRADDPFLVDKLLREKEGIFLWCLEGLHRLRVRIFHFYQGYFLLMFIPGGWENPPGLSFYLHIGFWSFLPLQWLCRIIGGGSRRASRAPSRRLRNISPAPPAAGPAAATRAGTAPAAEGSGMHSRRYP